MSVISRTLLRARRLVKARDIQVRELLSQFSGKGPLMAIILLALPFILPIPLPGLSVPFGILIMLSGLTILRNRPLWIPKSIGETKLPGTMLSTVLGKCAIVSRKIEKNVRPRLSVLNSNAIGNAGTILIMLCGIFLALPLPPGTNFLPALTIILLALGKLSNDGLLIILGFLVFVLNGLLFHSLITIGRDLIMDFV